MTAIARKDEVVMFETIDAAELAERWKVPQGWISKHTQEWYSDDVIPHVRLGRYVRYEWGSPALAEWWAKRRRQ